MITSTALAKGLILIGSLTPLAALIAIPSQGAPGATVDFTQDVQPILRAHCSPCHTGDQASGSLSLNSFESLMKGGGSGSVISKGSAEKSLLVDRILGKGGLPRMPMGFKPLGDHDVSLIRSWIDQGAKPPATKAPPKHWAFIPPKRPAVPKVGAWAVNPIDSFVLTRLKREGLQPSPPTDKTTLIRRATLDLIGLPPTPAEVDAFLTDKSANAYEKVVDRLLTSPHYGERMALPWLDAARYADSNGFQQDGDTFQWVWRDWVVKALNANMPFDKFTIEQLAGDLLPNPTLDQLVATAFNRNHMLNGEGGAIPEEQRYVNLFDRVDTTSATWLSLTMGCARCHDHKYDPLTQRDYYSMLAYFNQVPETGVPSGSGQYRIAEPFVYAGGPAEMAHLKRLEAEAAAARRAETLFTLRPAFQSELDAWRKRTVEFISTAKHEWQPWTEVGVYVGASFEEAFEKRFGPEDGREETATPRPEYKDGMVIPFSGDNSAFYYRRTVVVDRDMPFLISIGSDDGIRIWVNGQETLSRRVTRGVAADSDRAIVSLKRGENQILMKIVNGGGIGGFFFQSYPGGIDAKGASLLLSESPDPDQLSALFAQSFPTEELRRLRANSIEASSNLAKFKEGLPRVMVMSDAKPRKSYILNRGNYEEHLEQVDPSTPKSLPGTSPVRNRLGLAKWIVSANNPLTARVQVNRAWQLFFGRGLVRTEENFGVKGEPPTHPELLDWLAVDFRESGWNVKRLHKMIVMSNTYRQSSKLTSSLLKKDPSNQLFARAPRFRLPSMLLRDTALAASGLLNPKIGGRPVYPYQPKDIWDGLAITLERDFTYPQSKGADNHRRSLYTFWRRTAAPGNMFDSSSRQVCTVKPTLTSTPLHALIMMNDVTWVEAGRALANSVFKRADDVARLTEAFRRVCSRKPTPSELAILKRSLTRSRTTFRANATSATQYLSQGELKLTTFEQRNPAELAALTAVCVAIFNLDEAMTRE